VSKSRAAPAVWHPRVALALAEAQAMPAGYKTYPSVPIINNGRWVPGFMNLPSPHRVNAPLKYNLYPLRIG